MRITLQLILFPILLFSCSENKIKYTQEQLQGDWVEIVNEDFITGPGFSGDFGLGFQGDSIEFKLGFKSAVNEDKQFYFTQFKVQNDSIYVMHPVTNEWDFTWVINSIINDTLTLSYDDSSSFQMKKINYVNQSFTNFDQIVFSSEDCYGSCLAYSISLKSDGSVLFNGEGNVKNIGFYKTQIDSSLTNVIFRKYYNGNILNLENNYGEKHSHFQDLFTSFIKDEKIVKTIQTVNTNNGRIGPNELLWANISITRLLEIYELDSKLNNNHCGIEMYNTFYNDSCYLNLQKSECFYLWTELNNAPVVDVVFDYKYELRISDEFYYSNLNKSADNYSYNTGITKVKTNGRYYQFNFSSKKPIVYDLGYNFIGTNYLLNNFLFR